MNVKPSIKSLEGQIVLAFNVMAGVLAILEFVNATNVFSTNPELAKFFAGALTFVDSAFIIGRSWVKRAAIGIDVLDAMRKAPVQELHVENQPVQLG